MALVALFLVLGAIFTLVVGGSGRLGARVLVMSIVGVVAWSGPVRASDRGLEAQVGHFGSTLTCRWAAGPYSPYDQLDKENQSQEALAFRTAAGSRLISDQFLNCQTLRPMGLFTRSYDAPNLLRKSHAGMATKPGISSVDDVMSKPNALAGKTPAEVEAMIGNTPGWKVETLGKGSQKGNGWVLREYTPQWNPTGRQVRWHPGGGHHGPDPYWKVNTGQGQTGEIR